MKTLVGHTFIVGKTGSGKTYRLKYFLQQLINETETKIIVYLPIPNTPLANFLSESVEKIFITEEDNYNEKSIKNGLIKFINSPKKVLIVETDYIEKTINFYSYLSVYIKKIGNIIVIMDEASYFIPLHIKKGDYSHLHLFTQGQNNNVFVIATTQRPALVNKNAFLNCSIFYIYQLLGADDLKQLKNCIPSYLVEQIISKLNKGYCLKVDTSFIDNKIRVQFLKPLP